MLSISRFVHMCVCVSVCVSFCVFTFEVPFKRLFAPLPEVQCPKYLEIRNPWGKVMERSGLRFENFTNKGCKIAMQKKLFLGEF